MNEKELREEYETGRLDSVARLQNLRREIGELLEMRVPQSPVDVEEWWRDHKPAVAKKLKGDQEENGEGDNG